MTRTTNIKQYLKIGSLAALFAFIGIYSVFQMKALARGVELSVSGIGDGAVFETEVVELAGTAIHAKHISINGREIPVDEEERFDEELVLSPGYNIITIEAVDKFDKETRKTYRIFLKEKEEAIQTTLKD